MKNISVLGSTGSIGTQTIEVCGNFSDINIKALTAGNNIDLIEKQAIKFRPILISVMDNEKADILKERLSKTVCSGIKVLSGMEGLVEAATLNGVDTVVVSLVGNIGIKPTYEAIQAKKEIALATKEVLVSGGSLITNEAQKHGVRILPIDSEHSAIFQSLQGNSMNKIRRIILTASGGPFRGMKKESLKNVTAKEALNHPNWDMGNKITIDSATMMNKGLEIIEAVWLFGLSSQQVDVVVHRESIVHSLIEYRDHSVIAQLGLPDMRIPIQYALTWPCRYPSPVERLDLTKIGALHFAEPDEETFRCLKACRRAIERGGLAPAAANGANEEAVQLFLQQKISFLEIGDLVTEAMERQPDCRDYHLADVRLADEEARRYVRRAVGCKE